MANPCMSDSQDVVLPAIIMHSGFVVTDSEYNIEAGTDRIIKLVEMMLVSLLQCG